MTELCRFADLNGRRLVLPGPAPAAGDLLQGDFSVPPARSAERPLTPAFFRSGLVALSTLPNIGKHACAAQILELEERLAADFPGLPLAHVSSDPPSRWKEVDIHHPHLRAAGYSLHGLDESGRRAFSAAFGVAVRGERRVAHGLFALRASRFEVVEIPADQMRTPDIGAFLAQLGRVRELGSELGPG